MDLLYAVRDLGVPDPAADATSEETVRAALAREIDTADVTTPRVGRPRRSRGRMRWTVPALAVTAAATAAVVVATGVVGGSHAPGNLAATGTPGTEGQDTAYVIRRVSANLSAGGQSDVMELVTGNGSGVTNTDWFYTDPQSGVQYSQQVGTSGPTHLYTYVTVATPVADGLRTQTTLLDPVRRAYAITSSVGPNTGGDGGPSPAQTRRALNRGTVTQDGTATVDGQPTIKLAIPMPQGATMELYVNARTYRVVREVNSSAGQGAFTWNWLPATPANIADAKPLQIPAGYTQASMTTLNREATQH